MGIWQVQIWGDGFIRRGNAASFELGSIVEARNVDEAFDNAVALAKLVHPELAQAEHPPGPGAVINAEEIQEFTDYPREQVGIVELYWSDANA